MGNPGQIYFRDVKTLEFDLQGRYRVVIVGHSHKPRDEQVVDVL